MPIYSFAPDTEWTVELHEEEATSYNRYRETHKAANGSLFWVEEDHPDYINFLVVSEKLRERLGEIDINKVQKLVETRPLVELK